MEEQKLLQTPSQTVGPFFAYGLTPEQYHYDFSSAVKPSVDGTKTVKISGQVLDGEGIPIPDAMVELWRYDGDQRIIARCGTGTNQACTFDFKVPGPHVNEGEVPYFTVIVFMRGQLIHSYTRVYFEGEANETDPVFQAVPEERRPTLVAKKISDQEVFQFNIVMQGENETVFFDL